jgi:hypothetical protein
VYVEQSTVTSLAVTCGISAQATEVTDTAGVGLSEWIDAT